MNHFKRNFEAIRAIKPVTFIRLALLKLCCPKKACKQRMSPRARLYDQLMKKSESVLNKELDLKKFLTRQRNQSYALLGLLNNRQ